MSSLSKTINNRRARVYGSATLIALMAITLIFSATYYNAPAAQTSPTFSVFAPTATPGNPLDSEDIAVELGMKFRSDSAGSITGVRFYKGGAANGGAHVGHLWTSAGTLLGSVTFANETASGWQQALFQNPIQIAANTTYVVSYFAPQGHYAGDNGYFNSGVDNAPLHALSSSASGGNGVYAPGGGFPTNTWNSSNYWVDVVFTTAPAPPQVVSTTPASGATNILINVAPTATFSKSLDATTVNSSTVLLRDAANNPVPVNVSYSSGSFAVTLTPQSTLQNSQTYTVTLKGGAATPHITDTTGLALSADVVWSFATVAAGQAAPTFSIFAPTDIPSHPIDDENIAVELGMKFRSDSEGLISGVRFYKGGAANGGAHVGHLWTSAGTLLGSVTFTNETASGWQQALFQNPIPIAANTTYVVSYLAPQGRYAGDNSYFATAGKDNAPLHALSNSAAGGNGVYAPGGGFPANTWGSSNYWVDVVFTSAPTPPQVVAANPANGASSVPINVTPTATFSKSLDATTVNSSTVLLRDAANNPVPVSVSYSSSSFAVTLTPQSPLQNSQTYTVTLKGGGATPHITDTTGLPLSADVVLSFATVAAGPTGSTFSIFAPTDIPSHPIDNEDIAVELGMKFRSDSEGFITGVRFYKGGAVNGGAHVGHLWTSAGTLLGSVTFTNETASGWQQALFQNPIPIAANTTYVVSYFAPQGRYAGDNGYFATAGKDNAPLHALSNSAAGGNGVYSPGGGFPSNTWGSSNYWADVVFTTGPAPPQVVAVNPANGATGVPINVTPTATFSKSLDATTVNSSTVLLRDAANNPIPVSVSYSSSSFAVTLAPQSPLQNSKTYTVTLKGGAAAPHITDTTGISLASDYTWSFTTTPVQSSDPFAACDPPTANAIVCENSKPGTPAGQWDILGAGDESIQGFATDISVNRGQTVHFKVKTPSSDYRLDIYRLGYYGELGARFITTVQPSVALPQTQPDQCFTQPSTGLIDCGNWAESASWAVPANATSGIYIAKLVREDGPGESHMVFIVRDDNGGSNILFQTSDTTWQAYNSYGGNSLYVGSPAGRAYKVSYNRPFSTRSGDTQHDWVFDAEYPMVRFLERNGYDVSYFTGVDSDRRGAEIQEHNVFLSVGHDEYWSAAQRANVEAARNAGRNLAFFSGNIMFWKTRWENSIDASGTSYRTLVCYKETHANSKLDTTTNVWTGTWRDPRFSPPSDGGRPENALIGTIFNVNGNAYDAIKVPEALGKYRFWRNTDVSNQTTNQTATIGSLMVGYEWDEDLDNGFRPSGLIRLSTNTVNVNNYLQDYGTNYGPGVATHSLTMYRHNSGALVFSAGMTRWSWGLDNLHDQSDAPTIPGTDNNMRQATVNLFADMGVQPATLQSGLMATPQSTDTQPPASTITSPLAGGTVPRGIAINITGTASDTGGLVAGVNLSLDGGATWRRTNGVSSWSYNWTPTTLGPVTIRSQAIDDSGNPQSTPAQITVTVVEPAPQTCPCSIWSPLAEPGTPPENDPDATEVGLKFRSDAEGFITGVRFYKGSSANGGTHVGHLWTSTGTLLGSVTFNSETASGWQQANFQNPIPIAANTTYVVSYYAPQGRYIGEDNYFASSGVDNGLLHALSNASAGGNGVYRYGPGGGFPTDTFQSENYWVDVVFNNGPAAPQVISTTPTAGATDTPLGVAPAATFSEPLTAASVNSSTVLMRDAANNPVSINVSYTPGASIVTLTPQLQLQQGQTYTITLKGGAAAPHITDSTGSPLASDFTWSFTTETLPPVPPALPILVITQSANKFTRYYQEILRAEGFNNFNTVDVSQITDTVLAEYDVAILGETPLTTAQVAMLNNWVAAGGNLIAMRPDKQLASLLGINDASSVRSDAYLLINTSQEPGAGIVNQTIQYHSAADLYTLAGATQVAAIYSNPTQSTSNPAVTLRTVGTSGGQAAAFTFDLARSIVYTRQGNPAWAGQERDGHDDVIRPSDLFFPDYVNLDKVAIPQADELQRLLANMILYMNADRRPLPRFWYFPNMKKAVILMTGDDHGTEDGTQTIFDTLLAQSPAGCSIANWECYRSTSWIYTSSVLTNSEATAYRNQGFELGVHVNTNCSNWTPQTLEGFFASDLASFAAKYIGLPAQKTNRTHCIAWSDWATQPKVELNHGIRLDESYYYWPPEWVDNRPGFMTGSGIPMRYADLDGSIIDVYQAPSHLVNETDNSITSVNSVLDKALGPEGYYGVFGTHYDYTDGFEFNILNSAKARNVSLISAQQLLTWLDGRNSSSFGNSTWNGSQLAFSITVGAGANNLFAMIPNQTTGGHLSSLTINGSPVSFTVQTIKGRSYASFRAANGNVVATYTP